MEGVGSGVFHCPRCGTLKMETVEQLGPGGSNPSIRETFYVPKLVERCRAFAADALLPLLAVQGEVGKLWHRLGIMESINKPEDRA
jgi:hypothetical protein